MPRRSLCLFPDPALSASCSPVTEFNSPLQNLVADLIDTLNSTPGVGLAACQIGVLLRVCVINVGRSKKPLKAISTNHGLVTMVNPIVVSSKGEQKPREGCLSVPDLLANVQRFEEVSVRFNTPLGAEETLTARGFEALAIQHEVDHCNGLLFLDRVVNIKTDIFRRKSY